MKNFNILDDITDPNEAKEIASLTELKELFVQFFKTMCRYLIHLYNDFRACEKRARNSYEQKGDLSEDFANELTTYYENFKKSLIIMEAFSEVVGLDLPKLKDTKAQYQYLDGKIIFPSNLSFLLNKNAQIYADDQERAFYESFPTFELGSESEVAKVDSAIEVDFEVDEKTLKAVDPESTESSKKP